jgi:chemotaxis protein CheC
MMKEELQEALSELINISFGTSTATIADIFDNFATLHVPDISFIPLENLDEFILKDFNYQQTYTTTQQFKGAFQGEIVFAIDPDSAINMQSVIFAEDEVDDDAIYSDDELKQSILEIANILGSSCIGKLAELLSTDVTFAPPAIEFCKQLVEDNKDSPYSHVIVISTVLEFREIEIHGKLFIMFSDEMFSWLQTALENFVENI